MPRRNDIHRVLIVGSGRLVEPGEDADEATVQCAGQAAQFADVKDLDFARRNVRPVRAQAEIVVAGQAGDAPSAIPGITPAKGPNPRPRFDYGPDFGHGIIGKTLPVALKDTYGVLVPKVDADGNEASSVRLPDIAVPTATSMGWAVRSADAGGAGELCYLDGSSVPFARTKAEREAKLDPRPSLEERYRDGADYAAKVQKAASALAQEGYLLPEDAERIAAKANSNAW